MSETGDMKFVIKCLIILLIAAIIVGLSVGWLSNYYDSVFRLPMF